MKTTVIYHSADMDGIFCREIARHFLGDKDVEYIGWNFGDPKIHMPVNGEVYIMDLSPECLDWPLSTGLGKERMIWIDHHKTSIEKFPTNIPGYRIDGVAACRLAWQWFQSHPGKNWFPGASSPLPDRQAFLDRNINEPLAVRLAGEYDVWDKRDSDGDTFQYALRAEYLTPVGWAALFDGDKAFVNELLVKGRVCQRYAQNVDASICKSLTWVMEWEGLKWLTINHARFNSNLFAAKDMPETGHDALLGFRFDGRNWLVSMYHAKHRTDLDMSEIAKKHGGGGHRGSAGFVCKELPFSLT